jgi:[ribosomal protein S5]-alanine N-acetyltransferase
MYFAPKHTERLLVEPLTLRDATEWRDYFRKNSGLKFVGLVDDGVDLDTKAKQWIERQLWRYKTKQYGLLALRDKTTNALVGQCGLLTQEIDGRDELEIGYHVLPKFWGRGYATEAAQMFKEFAFTNALRRSLISIIHVDNLRSQRVAEKNGMRRTVQTTFKRFPVWVYRVDAQPR